MLNLLSIITFLPAVAALVAALFLHGEDGHTQLQAKRLALFATGATFLISLSLLVSFAPTDTGFQDVEEHAWILGLKYKLGVDGISVLFVMLTTFLMPITIGACWNVTTRVKEYMIAFLLLETLMIGVFVSLDLVLFYLFFEAGLIPMFLIIGIWGGQNRIYAAFKFFLYTFIGSVLMLVAMIYMYIEAGTTDIPTLMAYQFDAGPISLLGWQIAGGAQTLMFLAFFASFAVKLPMFPIASDLLAPLILWMSAIAIVYASLVALVQEDMKKLVAYSSVAHMGFVTMGIFAGNQQGLDGAIFQMLSHGLVAGALFLVVGVVYDRLHTREISAYGGLVNRMPAYAAVFMLFTMANVGLPGTSGFVGEFLTFMAVFQVNTWVAVVAATGVIFSAGYALWLYRRVMFGPLVKESLKAITDMDAREKLMFAPLVVLTLLLGVYPALITDLIGPSTEVLVANYRDANGIVDIAPGLSATPEAAADTAHAPASHAAPSH